MTEDHATTLARLRQVNRQLRKVRDRLPLYDVGDPRLHLLMEELDGVRRGLNDVVTVIGQPQLITVDKI